MSAQWKWRREAGAGWAIAAICAIGRYGGRALARAVLYPSTLYFMWRRPEERRDSRDYLSRVHGRPATAGEVFRHIHTFSQTVLDRLFLLGEDMRRFDVRTHGLDELHRHLEGGRGVLLFGSHLGSFEVLRVLSQQRPDVPIRVVLDRAHSASVTAMLEQINPEIAATVIDAGQDGPAIMLAIQEAAAQGAMIALLVDRTQPGEPSVSVPFLGAPARFPVAPWLIAAVLKIPVVLAFGLYRGGNRYDLLFEPFSDGIQVARRERAAALPALIARYAARLEDRVRDAPYNWFNFYDFWERGDDGVDPSANEAGTARAVDPPQGGVGGDRAVRAAAVLGPGTAGD